MDSYSQNRPWLHENFKNKNTLLITVGDSWTWGDSLGKINLNSGIIDDYEYRTTHIYGYHLSNLLDSDWVNIAVCGTDNINIMHKAVSYIKNLTRLYDHIQVVITLTESGRELHNNNFLNKQQEYNLLKGSDWPEYSELISRQVDATELIKECLDNNLMIGYDIGLYYSLADSTNIWDFLTRYEEYTFRLIKQLFKNVSCTVARNFTHSFASNQPILGSMLLPKTWVDIISEQGYLETYPKDIYVLSGIGLNPILAYIKETKLNDKEQLLSLISNSHQAINWLHNSKYNAKIATKHPMETAHQWWAEYIYKWL